MSYDYAADERIDPRIKAFMKGIPPSPDVQLTSRDQALEIAKSPAMIETFEKMRMALEFVDNEQIAPSAGLKVSMEEIASSPDGNMINLRIIRSDSDEILPCVYYIHGGGNGSMVLLVGSLSCMGQSNSSTRCCSRDG